MQYGAWKTPTPPPFSRLEFVQIKVDAALLHHAKHPVNLWRFKMQFFFLMTARLPKSLQM